MEDAVDDANETVESRHVVPCDEEGFLLWPHELSHFCPCRPEIDPEDFRVVLHNEFH